MTAMENLYFVGNTHFDPVWEWKWDEGMSAIAATFRSALDRMDEYPDFIYSFCCPPVFEWIKNTDPALFERIKARIKEGRWELSEGMWVQPDCFTPSGESLVRQGLYGQRYLKENFGAYARTAFNTDSFGHPSQLPQILKKCGMDGYVFGRPEPKHLPLESEYFQWRAPDGSAVKTYRNDQKSYLRDVADSIAAVGGGMIVYGVTDHGGAPTKKAIEDIMRTGNAEFSTVAGFFDRTDTGAVYSGELITGDYGPYVNGTRIKSANRRAEYALLNAEKSCVIAGKPEREALTACWKDVLFNQFHDILGGASVKAAYGDAFELYGRAAATAKEILHYNLLRVTNNIALPGREGDKWNLAVWNLNCAEFDGYVEAEVQWANEFPWYAGGIALEDADGVRYPCQVIRERSAIPGFRSRFLFRAAIPSMGYRAFRVIQTGGEVDRRLPEFSGSVKTRYYTYRFEDGYIASVTTKSGHAAKTLLRPVCFEDGGDAWAFKTQMHGKECEPPALRDIKYVEYGKSRAVLKASCTFRDSLAELYYTFYSDERYFDLRYRVNWNEKNKILKLISDLDAPEHTAATAYGCALRAESERELPTGEWLETERLSFALDGVFSYNQEKNTLGLNILRSPVYGQMTLSKPIYQPDPDADLDVTAQGITEGRVRVFMQKPQNIRREAEAFCNPPVVLCESNHGGSLPGTGGFLSASGCEPCAVKYAEDGDGVIVRGANYNNVPQRTELTFFGEKYPLDVAPYEIYTVKIKDGKIEKVNMLEE